MESPQLTEAELPEGEAEAPADEANLSEAERAAQFELIKSAISRTS